MKNCKSNLFSIFLIIVAVVIVVSIGGSIFRAVKQSSVYEGFSTNTAPSIPLNIKELDNVDCVYSQIPYPGASNPGSSSSNYTYLGNFSSYNDCVNNATIGPDAKAITWHKSNAGGYAGQCYSINNSNTQVPYSASTCGIIMPPAPAPAPAPAPPTTTYSITGPSIGPSGNSTIPVSNTVPMGNQTVYMIQDGGFTKMVQWPSNIAKYYIGDISSFSIAKWSTYSVQNPGQYILTPTPPMPTPTPAPAPTPTPTPTPAPVPTPNNMSDINTNKVCIPTNSDGSFTYKDPNSKYSNKPDPNYIYSNSNPPASGFFDQGTENYNQYLNSDYYWYGGSINKYSTYAPMANSKVPNGTDCSSAYSCPSKTTNTNCLPGPGPNPNPPSPTKPPRKHKKRGGGGGGWKCGGIDGICYQGDGGGDSGSDSGSLYGGDNVGGDNSGDNGGWYSGSGYGYDGGGYGGGGGGGGGGGDGSYSGRDRYRKRDRGDRYRYKKSYRENRDRNYQKGWASYGPYGRDDGGGIYSSDGTGGYNGGDIRYGNEHNVLRSWRRDERNKYQTNYGDGNGNGNYNGNNDSESCKQGTNFIKRFLSKFMDGSGSGYGDVVKPVPYMDYIKF